MKTVYATIISLLVSATYSLASGSGGNVEGLGFLATLFIGFGVMVLVFQAIPALLLFCGMLKGLFSTTDSKSESTLAGNAGKLS